MSIQLYLSAAIIALGLGIAAGEQEICQHHCLLDAVADFVLPAAFDAFSGGAPVVLLGLALLVYTLMRR